MGLVLKQDKFFFLSSCLYNLIPLWYHGDMNEISFNLRMTKDLKARLEELAVKDGRSLNNLINKVLCDFVAEQIVKKYRKEKEK